MARIAAPGATLGLPEVTLGIVPGAGGTQRLPRLVGLGPALSLIGEGRIIQAQEAETMGLVDAIATDPVASAGTVPIPARPATGVLPAPQREAVLRYVQRESGFDASVIVKTGACGFQWAGVRRRTVLAMGSGRCPSWEVQMEFADRELRTTYGGFFRAADPYAHIRVHFGAGKLG